MSEAKDSIANLSTNQQEPDTETQKVESLENIETEQQETADKVKPTPMVFNVTSTKKRNLDVIKGSILHLLLQEKFLFQFI